MRLIYEYDGLGVFTGNTQSVDDGAGAPLGWTRLAPPELSRGEYARFSGIDGWCVITELPMPPEPQSSVQEKITTLQAELQLIEDGLLQAVNDAIESLPEPERSKASAKWHKSRYIYRADSLVEQLLVVGLGRTEEQVDQMFISAAAID